MITASQIYDHVLCSHRPVMDARAPESERDETSTFTEMLWQMGVEHEASALLSLGVTADMSKIHLSERESATLDAMLRKEPLIYRGRISDGDLLGEPDLLELQDDGSYMPGDIKSGGGREGVDDDSEGRLKRHYAVQLGHYSQILNGLSLGNGRHLSFVVDNRSERVLYDLDQPQGVRTPETWFDYYLATLSTVRGNLSGATKTLPALGATCKLCHWSTSCKKSVIAADDLSLIPELGRSKRDVLIRLIPTVKAMASADISHYMAGKKTVFPGIGPATLEKYQTRAKLLSTPNATPFLKSPVDLPVRQKEIFFDIEADPFKDNFVYLHGAVERDHGKPSSQVYHDFFADGATPADEESVFAAAWKYLTDKISSSVVYFYSQYEPTSFKKLARKYPAVCSIEEVEALFSDPGMIDLYAIVKRHTEWPCNNFSIKTLAVYCGFKWRDESPSGAASIEWYRQWIASGDVAVKDRIRVYNEDDNIAVAYIVDAIRRMGLK